MQPRPEATTSLHILHLAHHREISTPTLTIHGSVYSCIGIGSNRRERNWPSTGCAKNVDIIKVSVGWALWGIYGGGGERGRIESVFQIHEGWSWPFIPLVRNPGGWVAGWLDHPPCGSLKWPTSIEMEVYRDRLVDEAGDSRWLVQIAV